MNHTFNEVFRSYTYIQKIKKNSRNITRLTRHSAVSIKLKRARRSFTDTAECLFPGRERRSKSDNSNHQPGRRGT